MKRMFYFAGGLLVAAGLLHLVTVFMYPVDMNAILPVIVKVVLAIAYLYIGVQVLRRKENLFLPGAVVAFIGLLLTLVYFQANPGPVTPLLMVVDILAVVVNIYLYVQGRGTIRRVR